MLLGKLLNLEGVGRFTIRELQYYGDELVVTLESTRKRCRCPVCHRYSRSVHSRYRRRLQDLPCFGRRTFLELLARKFYCRRKCCPQKVFTERFPAGIECRGRRTERLTRLLSHVTLPLSSLSAERLCHRLHIAVSDTTLGRLLNTQPLPEPTTPKVLGVDDWALKKRNRYGTILVDLERHQIIDVLPGRETNTLQKWLEEHSGVQVVSRDRYTNYAGAVGTALPGCIQVVDRWHLVTNLCDGLKKLVERNHQHLKWARKKQIHRLQKQSVSHRVRNQEKTSLKRTVNYTRRWVQFRQIRRWKKKGVPIRQMANLLGMSRNTVKKYLHLQEPPFRKTQLQVNITLFDSYILRRIKEDPQVQRLQLYREIKERGYNGARSTAYEHLRRYIKGPPQPRSIPRLPDIFYVPSKISFLLLRRPAQLNPQEQELVTSLCKQCPQIKTAYGLAREFKEMLEQKKGHKLKRWMGKVMASGIEELKSFAKGLLSDVKAIKNAFILPWSNGQVEGQINKLKTIKRMMYGRASFALLRHRLLLDSS